MKLAGRIATIDNSIKCEILELMKALFTCAEGVPTEYVKYTEGFNDTLEEVLTTFLRMIC